MSDGRNKCTIRFLHPRDSEHFEAQIGPATTGQASIDSLVRNNFIEQLPSGSYVLSHQRTGRALPLSAALVAEGVKDGDTVAIVTTSTGA